MYCYLLKAKQKLNYLYINLILQTHCKYGIKYGKLNPIKYN